MPDVMIFGTGSSGDRAWHAAASHPHVRVVGFADNDPTRRGRVFHGREVVSPDQLPAMRWDFVVVASMYADDIRRQLEGLGVPPGKIVVPASGTFAEAIGALSRRTAGGTVLRLPGGREVRAAELPRVLILTYETLNSSHGTGVLLQRYFKDFPPERLFSVCHTATGSPWLASSLVLPSAAGHEARGAELRRVLESADFVPELVYATAFNELDLELLRGALAVLPPGVPVVQHFMDYMPHAAEVFDSAFRALSPSIAAVWALTEGLSAELTRRYQRPVGLVTALHQDPPPLARPGYADVGPEFRAVILGNLWQPWTLPVIADIWRRCRDRIPSLRPIDWYVHATRAQAVVDAGYELGDEVVWRGFYGGSALQSRLQRADLALLPFNTTDRAVDSYTRYSLPSRLTELCGAGLPILALASADTEPARFLQAHGCGVSVAGHDAGKAAAVFVDLIRDRRRREALGTRSRLTAETEFALEPFHGRFLESLVGLASRPAGAS